MDDSDRWYSIAINIAYKVELNRPTDTLSDVVDANRFLFFFPANAAKVMTCPPPVASCAEPGCRTSRPVTYYTCIYGNVVIIMASPQILPNVKLDCCTILPLIIVIIIGHIKYIFSSLYAVEAVYYLVIGFYSDLEPVNSLACSGPDSLL